MINLPWWRYRETYLMPEAKHGYKNEFNRLPVGK
jgi:hypothetical protein